MFPQLYDLINNYKPDILWTDGEWEKNSDFWKSKDFISWLYNDSPVKDKIVLNDRWGNDTKAKHGGFYTAEYTTETWSHKWEQNSGIDVFSFGLNRNTPADKYFNATYLVNLLVRTVSNGGNFLLDIGPHADGTIPAIMQERLLQIGSWLGYNGEAIYNSRTWRVMQEGSFENATLRYTYNPQNNTVYAISMKWPENGKLEIPSPIGSNTTQVYLLGNAQPLNYTLGAKGQGLTVQLPNYNLNWQYAWTFKLVNVK